MTSSSSGHDTSVPPDKTAELSTIPAELHAFGGVSSDQKASPAPASRSDLAQSTDLATEDATRHVSNLTSEENADKGTIGLEGTAAVKEGTSGVDQRQETVAAPAEEGTAGKREADDGKLAAISQELVSDSSITPHINGAQGIAQGAAETTGSQDPTSIATLNRDTSREAASFHDQSQTPRPATPITPVAMSSLNPHAYMMMALAMSNPPAAMSPPPTVTPSQVTLPPVTHDHDVHSMYGNGNTSSVKPPDQVPGVEDTHLECFARLEFADSVFQITTFAVMIGRDQKAFEVARVRERREQEHQKKVKEHELMGIPPPEPPNHERAPRFSKSYVSEEGGMLGPASEEGDDSLPPAKRRKRSRGPSEHDDEGLALGDIISDRQYVSHTPGAAAVDLKSLRPSLEHVPFIGIHSPGPDTASKTKAISREHLKIEFNRKTMVFEAFPMHKNGFFRQDEHHCAVGSPVVLKCGDRIQIKDVEFQFIIPGVEKGKHGAEGRGPSRSKTSGGKEMSFDFEGSHGGAELRETSEDSLSELGDSLSELSDAIVRDFAEADDLDDADQAEISIEGDDTAQFPTSNAHEDVQMGDASMQDPTMLPQIPKKRGPGRPPKNGIMSKREQRLLKKQQQEMAKKTIPETAVVPVEPPVKRKVGRPRKHPLPEDADRGEKRKYKPRKPREDGAEGSDVERKAKEKKDKKVRPKSPPLDLKIEDYTEEQLQKPNKNYGVLIDETLTAAPDGLTLKQIYKRICQRYPWFYFHTETKGWESSVRHNLIGNEAFKKDEATNLWSRVPGVELDAGKKRKPTSPDRALAQLGYSHYGYAYNQQMAMGQPGMAPAQHQQPPQRPHAVAGHGNQPPHPPPPMRAVQFGPSTAPNGQPLQPMPAHQQQQQQHVHMAAPIQAPQNGLPQGTPPQASIIGPYSSPYGRPTHPAQPAIKSEDTGAFPNVAHAQPAQVGGSGPTDPTQPQPTPAQGARQTSGTPARRSEPPQIKPIIDTPLLNAVAGLREGLLTNLKKARNPQADEMVFSAINRSFGLKSKASENHKMEDICIKGINQVVQGYLKGKSPAPGQTSTMPAGSNQADWAEAVKQWEAAPKIMDFLPFHRIMGFKKVTIQTLEPSVGTDIAESIALSSIDRALGLLSTSVPAMKRPVDKNGKEIPVGAIESGLIKSMRQMLLGLGYSLPGTNGESTPTPAPRP